MGLTLETKIYTPAFANKPEWTGVLEAVLVPWGNEDEVLPYITRFNHLMDDRCFDTEEYGFEAGLATLTKADLAYIFDNPHARVIK